MRLTFAAIALAAAALPAAAQQPQRVGTTAAVNPDTTGTPPGGDTRILYVGNDVVFEERIATAASGQTQLLFLDQSSLTIGPNSEVVLDRFVYNPETSTGEMAISITKGVFRFVGGRISANSGASIRTPTATLGIRGSVVLGNAAPLDVVFVAGKEMTITNPIGTLRFDRNDVGRRAAVAARNAAPQDLGIAGGDVLQAFLQPLQSTGSGGATEMPTEERTAAAGVGTAAGGVVLAGAGGIIDRGINRAEDNKNDAAEQQGSDSVEPPPVQLDHLSGRYYSTPGTGSSQGFVGPGSFKSAFAGGTIANGRFTASVLESSFSVPVAEGFFTFDATDTQSPFGPVSGTGFFDRAARFGFYELREEQFSDEFSFLFFGNPLAQTDVTAARPFAVHSYDLRSDFLLASPVPFIRRAGGGDISGAQISDLLVAGSPGSAGATGLQGALAISGQGAGQQSVLSVFTGGSLQSGDNSAFGGGAVATARTDTAGGLVTTTTGAETAPAGNGGRFFGQTGSVDYFVLSNDGTGPSGYVERNGVEQADSGAGRTVTEYGFNHVASRTPTATGVGQNRESRTLNGYAAGIAEISIGPGVPAIPVALGAAGDDPEHVRITTDAGTNRVSAAFTLDDREAADHESSSPSRTIGFGGSGSANTGNSSFIDDKRFAARTDSETPGHGAVITHATLGGTSLLGTALCECEYLEWGYWSYDLYNPEGQSARQHIGSWVAGEMADISDFASLSGTASYSGHAIGNVVNNGRQYIATGSMTKEWNFGSRQGTLRISDFDNADYVGTMSSSNGRDFSGGLSGAGRSGRAAGSFFKGGNDPAAAVGGQFRVRGGESSYRASGTFAGAKTRSAVE